MARLEGKTALVTGGAMGIGKACCELFAREGANVVVTDVEEKEGRQVAEGIRAHGGEARFVKLDVTQEKDWEGAFAFAREHYGGLDVLVNNAGIAITGDVEHATLEDWRRTQRVNLEGVFLGTKYGVLAMKERGGSIVNLASIEGLIGDPTIAAYNASKAGVVLLTKSAALYCAREGYGIRVNSVCPGYIWTPMVENYIKSTADPQATMEYVKALHPVGRLGEPDDVAYGVLYLACDESKFVTGTELVIDGGYTAR
jgi:NAD(P)-dependent dehydrogenase (short-subunit alcohol dehydrogenase family)